MPRDLIRVDLDLVHPGFAECALDVLADCRMAGADFFWVWGYRAPAQSDDLVSMGAQAAGGWKSAHNYGLGGDFCHDSDIHKVGLQPDWKGDSPAYALLGHVAKLRGLIWGGDWHKPDAAHVQLPGYVTGAELLALRPIFEGLPDSRESVQNRLRRVWQFVDAHPKGT